MTTTVVNPRRAPDWLRATLLMMAIAVCLTLIIYPRILGTQLDASMHAALPLLLHAVSAAFVVGVGYVPHHPWARIAFHPVTSVAIFALAGAVMIALPR